jgi:hypothetical protein
MTSNLKLFLIETLGANMIACNQILLPKVAEQFTERDFFLLRDVAMVSVTLSHRNNAYVVTLIYFVAFS